MKQRLYPWVVFGVLVILILFVSNRGTSLEALNIWAMILLLVIVILGLFLRGRK